MMDQNPPIAFVAGATGLTGRYVVDALRLRNIQTIAHVRPDSTRLDEWTRHFEQLGAHVSAVPWREMDMTDALRTHRPNMVFALLGTTKKRARKGGGDYQKVDYGLTKLLLDASTQVSPSPSFVYLSAVGVSEETKNSYMKARAQVESALQDTELKRLIARPSFILGDRDEYRLGESLGAPILDGALAAFSILGAKRLTEKYRSMSGQDLAQGLVELALSGAQGIVHVPEIQAATQRFKESIL